MLRRNLGELWEIACILLAAFLLRAWPLLMGVPVEHPDEYTYVFIPLNFFSGDVNPHFFTYPTLHYYLLAGVYAIHCLASDFSFYEWVSFHYLWQPEDLLQLARWVSVFFSSATVIVVGAIVRRFAGAQAGLVAASILACNVIHVRQSSLAAVDIPLTFWVVSAVWAALRLLECGERKDYLIAGVLLGLATSCKYPAAAIAPVFLVAHVLAGRRLFDHRLWWIAGAALSSFMLSSPYVLLDHGLSSKHILNQVQHVGEGRGAADIPTALFHVWISLRHGSGWIGLLATLACLVFLLRRPSPANWVLFTALLCYYAMISWGELTFVRYALPLIALQATLLGMGWSRLVGRWRYVLWALLLVEPVYGSLQLVRIQGQKDTRIQARESIEALVPEGARIANFGGWAGDVQLRTIDKLWWRLRRFEDAYGHERVLSLLDFFERTRPAEPFYLYMRKPGNNEYSAGNWSLVIESEATHILMHSHLLEYSYIDTVFFNGLASQARHVQTWTPQGILASDPQYDWSDAYYVPIGDWGELREPGPVVEMWTMEEEPMPQIWSARHLLALAYADEVGVQMNLGNMDFAADALQKALDLGGDQLDVLYVLCDYYVEQEEYDKAQQVLAFIAGLDPTSWRPYIGLGRMYVKSRKWADAQSSIQTALDMGATAASVYMLLGVVQVRLGDVNSGIRTLQRVVETDANYVDGWFNLALALRLADQAPEARSALLRVLKLNPHYEVEGQRLSTLLRRGY